MGSLVFRSVLVLALLFGLVFAVGAGALHHYDFPISWAIAFAILVVTLQYLIGPFLIDWIFHIRWIAPEEISPEFAEFLRTLCEKRRIAVPRFGIIEDGNPNAFTYGHIPADSRLVVTRGLREMLTDEEFEAVVAHEVGHIRHYDFMVMTFAALAPMLLYLIYIWTRRERKGGAAAVAVSAYVAYIISQYIVLFLSRVREYFADEHAAESVKSANSISTALIKIAYGLVRAPQEEADQKNKGTALNPGRLAGSLGICSLSSASSMALYSTDTAGQYSAEAMSRAMQWDLWNPWARIFEFGSTHPLVARRVIAASRIARRRGETPTVTTSSAPKESYYGEFFGDLFYAVLPYVGVAMLGLALLANTSSTGAFVSGSRSPFSVVGLPLFLIGIGWMMRLLHCYRNEYRPAQIADLVGRIDVSHLRPIPVELTGEIIGRGVPGLFWSKDLVMQDETGFVPVIYKQPLGIIETLFGIFRAGNLIGKKGTFRGWYRRGPVPYLELKEAILNDGDQVRCHYKSFLWALAIVVTLIGIGLMAV